MVCERINCIISGPIPFSSIWMKYWKSWKSCLVIASARCSFSLLIWCNGSCFWRGRATKVCLGGLVGCGRGLPRVTDGFGEDKLYIVSNSWSDAMDHGRATKICLGGLVDLWQRSPQSKEWYGGSGIPAYTTWYATPRVYKCIQVYSPDMQHQCILPDMQQRCTSVWCPVPNSCCLFNASRSDWIN